MESYYLLILLFMIELMRKKFSCLKIILKRKYFLYKVNNNKLIGLASQHYCNRSCDYQ